MRDWQLFVDQVPWFLDPQDQAIVGEIEPWSRGSVDNLPELSALLASATVTPISIAGSSYELLGWGAPDNRRGWLGLPPSRSGSADVHPTHLALWTVCGGILERFGEPASWWLNQNEVLTASAACTPLDKVFADYAWLWTDHGLEVPILTDEYYVVAIEANGNLTLVHRVNGKLLLFAPDHAFDGVAPLPGCPPYSLLTISETPDLISWVEVCAAAWRGE